MRPRKSVCFVFIFSVLSSVNVMATTVSAVLGAGQSVTSNEISEKEGPFTQAYSVEGLVNSRLAVGVEHVRSLSTNLSTAIALSGLMMRYYINAAPSPHHKVDELMTDRVSFREYALFMGAGYGFAQSSRFPDENGKTSNAAGFYVSPRAGMDYQLTSKIGFRTELLIGLSVMGKGSISMFSMGAGVYYFF